MPEERNREDYYNQRETAAVLDVHAATLRRFVAAGTLRPIVVERKNYYLKTDVDAFKREQYPDGLSYKQIAARYNVSTNTVKNNFKRLRVPSVDQRHRHRGVVFALDTADSVARSLGWLKSRSNGS